MPLKNDRNNICLESMVHGGDDLATGPLFWSTADPFASNLDQIERDVLLTIRSPRRFQPLTYREPMTNSRRLHRASVWREINAGGGSHPTDHPVSCLQL